MRVAVYQPPHDRLPLSLRRYFAALAPELQKLGVELVPFGGGEGPPPADLVWDPYCGAAAYPVWLKDPVPAPVVVTFHGAAVLALPWHECFPTLREALAAYPSVLAALERWLEGAAKVARVVCPSHYAAQEICRVLGIERERLTVAYHGVDHAVFTPDGPKEKDVGFLCVVQWQAKKNTSRLLQAWAGMPATSRPPLTLVAPGLPEEDSSSLKGVRGLRVVRTPLEPSELAAYYRGALAFVFPSLHETFGLPVAEAMACGCPVLTSRGTALEELYSGAALLVDPRSVEDIQKGLVRLAEDVPLRSALRAAGLQRAAGLTWAASAAAHWQAFQCARDAIISTKRGRTEIAAMTEERLNNTAILVLGVHRSGTSAVTGVLHHLGVYLGPDLMPPGPDNPKGYFEHNRIWVVHDDLFSAFHSSWDDPRPLPPAFESDPRVEPFAARLKEILRRDFAGRELWGLKDPRLCKLLPLWLPLLTDLGVTVRCLLVVRDPAEVAASLGVRDGMPLEQALELWLMHTLLAERHTRGQLRSVVFYEDLLRDWRAEVARVAEELGLTLALNAEEEALIDDFLSEDLRHHHRPSLTGVDAPQSAWARAAFDVLRAWRDTGADPAPALGGIAARWEEAQRAARAVSQYLETRFLRAVSDAQKEIGQELERKAEELREKDDFIRHLTIRLNAVESTLAFKFQAKWNKFRLHIILDGSARHRAYTLFVKVLHSLMDHGVIPTAKRITDRIRQKGFSLPKESHSKPTLDYQTWIARREPSRKIIDGMRQNVDGFPYKPLISIVMPVYNTKEEWLRAAIESVRNQVYPFWELCIADDASTDSALRNVLEWYSHIDSRIKVRYLKENHGISGASNAALALASGEYIGLLDHDDELAPWALYEVVRLLNERPDLDFIYSDEDKLEPDGRRSDPFFKPDWSPELLMSMNYITHFAIIRRSLVERVGGFRPGFEGSQDYDLFLRVTECTDKIAHIPAILYHWRKHVQSAADNAEAKRYAYIAATRALDEALKRRGEQGRVEMITPGRYLIHYRLCQEPLVSIIIPTRDKYHLLRKCINSIMTKSQYQNYEIVVIDNGSTDAQCLGYLHRLEHSGHRVLRIEEPFNWSRFNNMAARVANGELLLFLNDDTEVITPSWLEEMIAHALRPGVGAVGAKLLFPNGTIQHAGVIVGLGGVAGHAFYGLSATDPGYMGLCTVVRNCSAVTGACMLTKTELFKEIGGFDERLDVAYNDVDFCVRLLMVGYRIVWTSHAVLIHHEFASRGRYQPEENIRYFCRKWAEFLDKGDPYYNPNLALDRADFAIDVNDTFERYRDLRRSR